MSYQSARSNLLTAPAVAWLLAFMVAPCLLILSYAFFQRGVWGGVEYTFTLEKLQPCSRSALCEDLPDLGAHCGSRDAARHSHRLSRRLCDQPGAAHASAHAAVLRSTALLEQLPDPHLCLDGPAQPRRTDRQPAAVVRLSGRAAVPALHRGRRHRRPRLQLPALRHSCDLLDPVAPQSGTDGSLARPRRRSDPHLLARDPAAHHAGVAAGGVFVFVLSIGNFVTALLGGGRFQMIGNVVYDQFLTANDWPWRSAWPGPDRHHDHSSDAAGPGDGLRQRRAYEGRGMKAANSSRLPGRSCPARRLRPSDRGPGGAVVQRGRAADELVGLLVQMVRGAGRQWRDPRCGLEHAGGCRLRHADLDRAGHASGARHGNAPAKKQRPGGAFAFALMVIPDIVLAVALLTFFSLNVTLGLHTIVISHVIFDLAFVSSVVRARLKHFDYSIVEASRDLGASGWTTFLADHLPGSPARDHCRRPARLHAVGR